MRRFQLRAVLLLMFSQLLVAGDKPTFNYSLCLEIKGTFAPIVGNFYESNQDDLLQRVRNMTLTSIRVIPACNTFCEGHSGKFLGQFIDQDNRGVFAFAPKLTIWGFWKDLQPIYFDNYCLGTGLFKKTSINNYYREEDLRYEVWKRFGGLLGVQRFEISTFTYEKPGNRKVLFEEKPRDEDLDVEFIAKVRESGRLEYEIRNSDKGGNVLVTWDHGKTWEAAVPDQQFFSELGPKRELKGTIILDPEKLRQNPDPLFLMQASRGLKFRVRFFSYARGMFPDVKKPVWPSAPSSVNILEGPPSIVNASILDLPEDARPPHRYLWVQFNKPVYSEIEGKLSPFAGSDSRMSIYVRKELQIREKPTDISVKEPKKDDARVAVKPGIGVSLGPWSGPIVSSWKDVNVLYPPFPYHAHIGDPIKNGVDQIFIPLPSDRQQPPLETGRYRVEFKGEIKDQDGQLLQGEFFEFDVPPLSVNLTNNKN